MTYNSWSLPDLFNQIREEVSKIPGFLEDEENSKLIETLEAKFVCGDGSTTHNMWDSLQEGNKIGEIDKKIKNALAENPDIPIDYAKFNNLIATTFLKGVSSLKFKESEMISDTFGMGLSQYFGFAPPPSPATEDGSVEAPQLQ